MRIGEAAELSGTTPKAIRYYESIGLLPEAPRTPTGYRDYDAGAVERLRFIRRAADLGLPLDEIRRILELCDRGERPCSYVEQLVAVRLHEVERQLTELAKLRDDLGRLLARARGRSGLASARFCDLFEAGP